MFNTQKPREQYVGRKSRMDSQQPPSYSKYVQQRCFADGASLNKASEKSHPPSSGQAWSSADSTPSKNAPLWLVTTRPETAQSRTSSCFSFLSLQEEHGGPAHTAAGRGELGEPFRSLSLCLPFSDVLTRGKGAREKHPQVGSGLRRGFSKKRWRRREAARRPGRFEAGCGLCGELREGAASFA